MPSKSKMKEKNVGDKPTIFKKVRTTLLASAGMVLLFITLLDIRLYGVNAFTYIIGSISIILIIISVIRVLKMFLKNHKKGRKNNE